MEEVCDYIYHDKRKEFRHKHHSVLHRLGIGVAVKKEACNGFGEYCTGKNEGCGKYQRLYRTYLNTLLQQVILATATSLRGII